LGRCCCGCCDTAHRRFLLLAVFYPDAAIGATDPHARRAHNCPTTRWSWSTYWSEPNACHRSTKRNQGRYDSTFPTKPQVSGRKGGGVIWRSPDFCQGSKGWLLIEPFQVVRHIHSDAAIGCDDDFYADAML